MDRPTLTELIDVVRAHLESAVIPVVKGDARLYFQTLIAVNLLRTAEREIQLRPAQQHAAWDRLNGLTGETTAAPTDPAEWEAQLDARSARLALSIDHGAYDDDAAQRRRLFDHLLATTREALEIANPKLLQTMDTEWEGIE